MLHEILVLLTKPKPVLVLGIFALPLLERPLAGLGADTQKAAGAVTAIPWAAFLFPPVLFALVISGLSVALVPLVQKLKQPLVLVE